MRGNDDFVIAAGRFLGRPRSRCKPLVRDSQIGCNNVPVHFYAGGHVRIPMRRPREVLSSSQNSASRFWHTFAGNVLRRRFTGFAVSALFPGDEMGT